MDKNEVYAILDKAYFSEDHHEKDVIKHLPELLGDARFFVDIGASLGQYTFFANARMSGAQILAIEADPIRYERLKQNCEEWQASSKNRIRTLHGAVSDKDGKIKFNTTNSNISGGLFTHPLAHLSEESKKSVAWEEIEVNTFKLDTVCKDIAPDLVKIDVEGSELRVLKGCEKILKNGNTKFLIELHDWADPEGQKNASEVVSFMRAVGYERSDFHGKPLFTKHRQTGGGFLFFRISRLIKRLLNGIQGRNRS